MKRILVIGAMLFLLFVLTSCGERRSDPTEVSSTRTNEDEIFVTPAYVKLGFASPEELIEAYKLVRARKADRELAEQAESVDFAELEKLYLPTKIPEPYQLYWISVGEGPAVSIGYHRDEGLPLDYDYAQYFVYTYSRQDASLMEVLMQQYDATEKDLIDGKYLLSGTNSLCWAFDGNIMRLSLPYSLEVLSGEISVVEYLGLGSVEELAQFAELEVIDLTELVE